MRELIARVPGLRPFVRMVRRLPDQVLHPWRRRRARRRMASLGPLRRIVVLCLGNINRSAYAAALMREWLSARGGTVPEVSSAGFIGPDRPSPVEAVAIAKERGIDLSAHRSQLVTAGLLRGADLVLVMNGQQVRAVRATCEFPEPAAVVVLGDLDPLPIRTREIRDPYDQEHAVYASSFDRIERCVREVLRASGER